MMSVELSRPDSRRARGEALARLMLPLMLLKEGRWKGEVGDCPECLRESSITQAYVSLSHW